MQTTEFSSSSPREPPFKVCSQFRPMQWKVLPNERDNEMILKIASQAHNFNQSDRIFHDITSFLGLMFNPGTRTGLRTPTVCVKLCERMRCHFIYNYNYNFS